MGIFLKKGDTIGVAAPSARFDRELFERGMACLKDMGFGVKVPEGIFGQHRYLAGTDDVRAGVVNELFRDPEVKGIISVRGGFGAMRMLPHLDWELIKSNPTLYVGFSDASALIAGLNDRAGQAAVHGPNLVSLAKAGQKTLDAFYQALTGGISILGAENGKCLASGRSTGTLVGGNLATLAHMVGTPFQPDFNGGVLFIEDVGEPAYKIDRMLSQMDMAGCFEGIRGVVAGTFEDCANGDYIPEIIAEIFLPKGVPVCMGMACGHGPVNLSLTMGVPVSLDADRTQITWGKM